jgi:hypothetical protein
MEFIRTLKEKSQTRREEEIRIMAEEFIGLKDFNDTIYIAFQGTPLVSVKDEWTSKEIVQELAKVRANYIDAKLKENGLSKIAAAL